MKAATGILEHFNYKKKNNKQVSMQQLYSTVIGKTCIIAAVSKYAAGSPEKEYVS